jgi:serralysin
MGVGYNKSLTTWHNGTNSNSSTSYQDDMSVIASSGNGFGYRQDDWGNTIATAGVLTGSTQLSVSGVISTMTDVDVFRFTTGAGTVTFDIKGASLGQNLDVLAKLLDDKGNEIVVSNPSDKVNASISTALNAGTYYLQVGSNGQYGRVGQYTVAGNVTQGAVVTPPEASINNVTITEGQAGNTATFTVSLSKAATGAVSIDFATANGTASSGTDYTAKTGTINFAAGETSKTVTVSITDDSLVENNETFNVNLSNAKGVTIKDGNGIGTIVSDDIATPPVSGTMGEIGRVANASSTVKTFTFQNTYQNPVVFAQPLSRNGGDSAVVRITDITSNSFSFFVDEPNSSDNIHANETFSFMVLEAGTWKLDNGATVRVGTMNTDANVNNNWQNVDLGSDFTATPVVLTQVQSDNGVDFVRTRQQNTSTSGFSVAMEKEEEFVNSTYAQEKIGWFAITGGTGDWNGFIYQADYTGDRVTDRFSTLSFEPDFKTSPQILGNVASYNDPDPVGLRYRRLSDVKVDIMLDEDQGLDDERTHGTENVSFLAIEGTGSLTGTRDSGIANGLAGSSNFYTDSNLFILGNELGSFYSYRGDTDYALIGNFQVDRGDTIQLYGSASDYRTVSSENGLSASTSIYDAKDDLIAIVKGVSSLNLDSSVFSFI